MTERAMRPQSPAGEEGRPPGAQNSARTAPGAAETAGVALFAALLFATTLSAFGIHVTDVSALRMLDGDVPYRDFWTMYAPASSALTALAYAAFGREMIVSNLCGLVVSAASVAAFHRFARAVMSPVHAFCAAGVVAVAFFGTGYHATLSSYPLASLAIWFAWHRLLVRAGGDTTISFAIPGLAFALAVASKHDLAGYAAIAAALALLLPVDRDRSLLRRLGGVIRFGAIVAAGLVPLVIAAALAGAMPDLVRDLLVFPLTDFPAVRWEDWSGWPDRSLGMLRYLLAVRARLLFAGPFVVALPALAVLLHRRARLGPNARRVAIAALAMLPLLGSAAQVQLNTHAITLAAVASLLAGIAANTFTPGRPSRRLDAIALGAALLISVLYAGPAAIETAERWRGPLEPVALPGLRGILVTPEDARWMRGLADAIERAAPPGATLLFAGRRNDVMIHARNAPAWLSRRKPATRYSELHPAITDTERVQREMIAALDREAPPVVVREHRFPDDRLERAKARYLERVPVGAGLLDAWIAARHQPGPIFGLYEVMLPREAAPPAADVR